MALKGGWEEPSLKKDFFFPRMNLLQVIKENSSNKSKIFL